MSHTSTGQAVTAMTYFGQGRYAECEYVVGSFTSVHGSTRYELCVEVDGVLEQAFIGGVYATPEEVIEVARKHDAAKRAEIAGTRGRITSVIYDDDDAPTITRIFGGEEW